MNISAYIRPNILAMKAYSSARDEFHGEARVFLDANENPYDLPYHRYPDPHQHAIKEKLGKLKGIEPSRIFLGNGSDEPIDLVIRMTCIPGTSSMITLDPTYGMYEVSAAVNDVEVRKAALTPDFQLDPDRIRELTDETSRLLFLCSPNNPSGNRFDPDVLEEVIRSFPGIVVLDEAYADFSNDSLLGRLDAHKNLIILQTFSKAWGMAGLRVGVAYASEYLVGLLDKIKPPYNINQVSQQEILRALDNFQEMKERVNKLIASRESLSNRLSSMSLVDEVFPSDANFLLVRFQRSDELFRYLLDKGIIVRDRSRQLHCEGCLRLTVGTPQENVLLLEAIESFS